MLNHPTFGEVPPVTGGGDPLGTAPVNEMLYRTTFPGINNVVRYIRVYTAICWMVHQIAETARKNKRADLVELTKTGMEKIQLLLTWYNWGEGVKNLAGNGRTFRKDGVPVELRFQSLLDNSARIARELDADAQVSDGAHFLNPAQYRPGLFRGFAFMGESSLLPGTYHLTEGGKQLADAYEEAITGHDWRDWLADLSETHASYEDVREMRYLLDLKSPSIPEQNAFLTHYYPEANYAREIPNWRNRHAGITLALRALAAETGPDSFSKGRAVSVATVRQTMARGVARNGKPLDLTNLESIHGIWSSLQIRQCFRKAMDILVRCTESWIKDAEIYQRPRSILDCSEGIGAKLADALPPQHSSLVKQALDEYAELRGEFPTFGAAAPTIPELRLQSLINRLRETEDFAQHSEEETAALRNAYYALGFCVLEVETLSQNSHFLLRHNGSEDLPLAPFCKMVREFENRPPAELMAHIIQYYIVAQHFKVMRRRTDDFHNRFRFMNGDDGLERALNAKDLYGPNELEDLLEHALYLLAQCGLAELDDGNRIAITEGGENRLATYELPAREEQLKAAA